MVISTAEAPPDAPITDPFAVDEEDLLPPEASSPVKTPAAPEKGNANDKDKDALLCLRQAKSDKPYIEMDITKMLFEGEPCPHHDRDLISHLGPLGSQIDVPTSTSEARFYPIKSPYI
jgi:hypothetical protein